MRQVTFCVWHLPLSIMFPKFTHGVPRVSTSFVFMAESYFVVRMDHMLLTHPSVGEQACALLGGSASSIQHCVREIHSRCHVFTAHSSHYWVIFDPANTTVLITQRPVAGYLDSVRSDTVGSKAPVNAPVRAL